MRLLTSIIIVISFFPYVFAQNAIDQAISTFVNSSGMEHASISFHVIDATSGTLISQHNSKQSMPTASTAKLFSTATALDILGPNFRPKTRIYTDGQIDSTGKLVGNLWIRGGGDPSIGSKYFLEEGHELDELNIWVTTLQNLGIKEIEGNVIADASEFGYAGAPGGWSWNDMGNYYGAGPSGLTIFDNMLKLKFNCPNSPGALTKLKSIEPYVPNLIFHNYIVSSERQGDNAYLFGAPFSLDRFGTGTLPAGSSNFLVKGSIPDPELQFAYELYSLLQEKGLTIQGEFKSARSMEIRSSEKSYANRKLLHVHEGQKLFDLIYHTNMRSVNLYAEHMLNLVGYSQMSNGSTDSGLSTLEKYWSTRISAEGLYINDGSGLSRSNAISASHFTDLLKYMHASVYAEDFKESLPVAGVSGTLKSVCSGQAAQGKLRAKSGSMSRIKSYAGYLETSSGQTLAFALIVNNYDGSSSSLKQKMERVFNQMVSYK